jgi:hypothetical protein
VNELVKNQKAYLLSCQLPSGAFRLAPRRDQINPYFTNLALISLVRLGEGEAVRKHVDWYLHHVNGRGYVNDYRLDGEREVDTGHADSEDSYHATLFSLLVEWLQLTGDTDWLRQRRDELAFLVQAVGRLQQKDGLTWAKHSYRVKYLMDNCEVAIGLEDAATLFAALGDDESSREARYRAEACRRGIAAMYSPTQAAYAMYDRTYPAWRKWYPDVTSQAFPIVYGLAGPDTAYGLYERITAAFPHYDSFQTGDLYPWMVMGECARRMGDVRRVERMLQTAADLYIRGPRLPYWLIHETGRFLELMLAAGSSAA